MYYTLSVKFYGCERSCYLTKEDEFREYSRSDGSDEAMFKNKTEIKKKITEIIDQDWYKISIEKLYSNSEFGGVKTINTQEFKSL
jgi:hypothetical protein